MHHGFAVFNSACDLKLMVFFHTHFNGTGVRTLIKLFGWMLVGTRGFIEAYCPPRDVFTLVLNLVCTSYTTDSANCISTHRGSQEVEVRVSSGSGGMVLLGAGRPQGNIASNGREGSCAK